MNDFFTKQLSMLKERDIYSLILFALYILSQDEKYSTCSELAYVLDKNNLFKLCEYFGGLTIKIPSMSDLKKMIQLLTLYQLVELDGVDFDTAISNFKKEDIKDIEGLKVDLIRLCRAMKDYEIK